MQTEIQKTTFSIEDLNKDSTIATNVGQKYIVTTYDKIKLALIDWEKAKKFATEWWTYLGMTLSFLIPIFTADFKGFLGLSADFLRSLFIVLSLVFGILTIVTIIRRIRNRKEISIDSCVSKIINQQ